jgi:hypothetical protein
MADLTTNTVRQTIISDPQQARELGAVLAAERATTTMTRQLGQFEVDGQRNGVVYDRQSTADVERSMAGQITMTPGSVYEINAGGTIDKGGLFGRDVGPEDAQRGRDGTRLQVAVTRDGHVLQRYDYEPGMKISTDVPGARLGFYFADGDLSDNSGRFNVRVQETSVRRTHTNVAVAAADADGVDAAAVRAARAFDRAPAAGSLPEPTRELATIPAGKGIAVDRDAREIATPDGYRFEFDRNELRVYLPGRTDAESAATTFRGRQVIEGDGTRWTAESGNYHLPNGSMFQLEYDGDRLKRFTLANGDSKVNVTHLDHDNPRIGSVTGGGYAWRRDQVENNLAARSYRMGGYNDRIDDLDVTWNMERYGANIGRMEDNGVVRAPYAVDPELRGEFGTPQYERMLRSAIEDERSRIAGEHELGGYRRDLSRSIADYLLGRSGAYDQVRQELLASKNAREGLDPSTLQRALLEQMWMRQILGGLPSNGTGGGLDQSLAALAQLRQQLALQRTMQGDFDLGRYALPSLSPAVAAAMQMAAQRQAAATGGYSAADLDALRQALLGIGVDPRQIGPGATLDQMLRSARSAGVDPALLDIPRQSAFEDGPQGGPGGQGGLGGVGNAVRNLAKGLAVTKNYRRFVNPSTLDRAAEAGAVARGRVDRATAGLRARFAKPGGTALQTVAEAGREGAVVDRGLARGVTPGFARGSYAVGARGIVGAGLRGALKIATPVAIGLDGLDLVSSAQADSARGDGKHTELKRSGGRVVGGWAGAIAGVKLGMAGGAAAGAFFGGIGAIPGAVLGAAVGAVGGAIGGSIIGSSVGEWVADKL